MDLHKEKLFSSRDFIKVLGLSNSALLISRLPLVRQLTGYSDADFFYSSGVMEITLSSSSPEIMSFNIDGLAQGKRNTTIAKVNKPKGRYRNKNSNNDTKFHVQYRPGELNADRIPPITLCNGILTCYEI